MSLSEQSAVCQSRLESVRAVWSLSEPSGVCQSSQQSVRAVGGLSEPSAVCQALYFDKILGKIGKRVVAKDTLRIAT